jgi:hypothetical protein
MKPLLTSTAISLLLISLASISYGQDIVQPDINGSCDASYFNVADVCLRLDLVGTVSTEEIVQMILDYQGRNTPATDTFGQANGVAARSCFETSITNPTPFMGNHGELFRLANGMIGEVFAEYEYMYEYYPSVTVCPSNSMMIVKGKRLNINIHVNSVTSPSVNAPPQSTQSITLPSVIESKIDDEFEGYEAGNIYKLRNGQLWEQISGRYRYRYKYAPDVIIVNRNGSYQMQVEGMEDWVTVILLN